MMLPHSYIFNSKKYIYTIIKILITVLSIVLMGTLFSYLLVDDTQSYTRITLHEMYNQDKNIDILFLGSSHTYRSFNTEITDSIFGVNTFNAGTSSQRLDGSYTLLKEVCKTNDVKEVYLELFYGIVNEKRENRINPTETYIIADYMKPSVNKYSYLMEATRPEYYINSFIPARRNWKNIFDGDYIYELLAKKSEDSYKSYEYIDLGYDRYLGKGFVACSASNSPIIADSGLFKPIKDGIFSQDSIKSLTKIMAYCQKHDIKLTVVAAPVPELRLVSIGNYDNYIRQVKELLEPYDIDFYDFNLCKESFFQSNDCYFMDTDHLNENGAHEFSQVFSNFFVGNITEDQLFYSSYDEKVSNHYNTIYGILEKHEKESSDKIRHLQIIPSENNDLLYSISYELENGQLQTLNYSSDTCFDIPTNTTGSCIITYYSKNDPANIKELSFDF